MSYNPFLGGLPAQAKMPERQAPAQVGVESEDVEGEVAETNRPDHIPDGPYSGGPDRDAIYAGPAGDPMNVTQMPTSGDQQPPQVGADAAAEVTEPVTEPESVTGQREDSPADPASDDAEVERQLREEYDKKTIPELKEEAKSRDMAGYSQFNKDALIDLLVTDDLSE